MQILFKYFPELTAKQIQQFQQLEPVYQEWNEKINVISRKDIEQIYERHVLHSLAIAKVITFAGGSKILDAGTGGGFPGLPLAILFPDVQFLLVDSIGKKIKVVKEIIVALGLKNAGALQSRVEELNEQFDFSVSRAVAPLKEMIGWLNPLIRKGNRSTLPNGMLFLKGGDLTRELAEIKEKPTIYSIPDYYQEEYFAGKKIIYLPKYS